MMQHLRSLSLLKRRYTSSVTANVNAILVLNAGSSSLKYKLFQVQNEQLLAECYGKFEQISNANQQEEFRYTHVTNGDIKTDKYVNTTQGRMNYVEAVHILFNDLLQLSSSRFIVGHRIVHGGDTYSHPQLIDDHVLHIIDKYSQIAPLHNPYQHECIMGINAQPNLNVNAQFAVFDTAFHSQMPSHAYKYAINHAMASDYETDHSIQIRRYGFHGISYEYILNRTATYLNKDKKTLNLIAVHLGSGCSMCCIKNGVSVDTSMGFTPSEGLIMGTRCGDVDSGLLFALMEHHSNDRALDWMKNELNKESGLKGICGTSDMRQILLKANETDATNTEQYRLALSMFAYRIKKYIGAYYALLDGNVDGLVFTGGIGENIPYALLHQIVGDLGGIGFEINDAANDVTQDVASWNNEQQCIPILSVLTDEELAIAQQIQQTMMDTQATSKRQYVE